jgi:hypothetical protein
MLKRGNENDIDDALRFLAQVVIVLAAAEERAKVEREGRKSSGLRAYTAIRLVVSEWSERFGPLVHTRAGRAYVEQARALS